jgi:hypothetical protein
VHTRIPGYLKIIENKSSSDFFGHFRMSREVYNWLLDVIKPYWDQLGGERRPKLCADEALLMTIWYLANTDPYRGTILSVAQ